MKLKEAWNYVLSGSIYLFIDEEFFGGLDKLELEKSIDEYGLWNLEVAGFSAVNDCLKIYAYHPEE